MSRRLAREIAFKTLFQYDVGHNEEEPALSSLLDESGLNNDYAAFARELVSGTIAHQAEIDQSISPYLQHWEMDRLAAVDRSILRLATYELLFRDDIPTAVSINEALDLSKAFNSDEAAKFLNGVLDKLAHDRLATKGDA